MAVLNEHLSLHQVFTALHKCQFLCLICFLLSLSQHLFSKLTPETIIIFSLTVVENITWAASQHTLMRVQKNKCMCLHNAAGGHQRTLMKRGLGTRWVTLEPSSPRVRQTATSAIDFQLTLKWPPVKDDLSEQLRGAYPARHHVGRLKREMAGGRTQETLSWAY